MKSDEIIANQVCAAGGMDGSDLFDVITLDLTWTPDQSDRVVGFYP